MCDFGVGEATCLPKSKRHEPNETGRRGRPTNLQNKIVPSPKEGRVGRENARTSQRRRTLYDRGLVRV